MFLLVVGEGAEVLVCALEVASSKDEVVGLRRCEELFDCFETLGGCG